MLITPDFSEAVEVTSEPIPSGVYKARVTDVELKETKAGEKRLSWKLQIFGAEGELARYNNWPVYYSTMITGKGAGMLKSFILATTGEAGLANFNTDDCLGKEVQITVAQRFNQDGSVSAWPDVKSVKALK